MKSNVEIFSQCATTWMATICTLDCHCQRTIRVPPIILHKLPISNICLISTTDPYHIAPPHHPLGEAPLHDLPLNPVDPLGAVPVVDPLVGGPEGPVGPEGAIGPVGPELGMGCLMSSFLTDS